MPPEPSSARTLARRLVMRGAAGRRDAHLAPAAVAAACERAYQDLERWLGPAGSDALFTRALAQARATQRALGEIRLRQGPVPTFEHVDRSIGSFGAEAVALALEEVLVALIALLDRMIGGDMAERLLDPPLPGVRATDAVSGSEQLPDHDSEPGATRATPPDASSR